MPTQEQIRRVAQLLKQVSDPTRLSVMLALHEGELNVSRIHADFSVLSQPALSFHLKLLVFGGLIEYRREQRFNFYSLTESGRKLVEIVRKVR